MPEPRIITVVGCQISQKMGDRQFNIQAATDAIRSDSGHEIYVLPELSSSGYGESVFDRIDELAEPWDGPSFAAFSDLARELGCAICYSFPRRRSADEVTIAVAVVGPEGNIEAKYDKWHVCSTGDCCERTYFADGKEPLAVFEICGIRVGICICYDIRFPELTRQLVISDEISLLLHPGGWPRDGGFETWHKFVTTRAVENTIYIMSTNWAGPNNGGTFFCPPFVDGKDLRPDELGTASGLLVGTVDPQYLREVRSEYPYLRDRNREMYAKETEWLSVDSGHTG